MPGEYRIFARTELNGFQNTGPIQALVCANRYGDRVRYQQISRRADIMFRRVSMAKEVSAQWLGDTQSVGCRQSLGESL